MRLGWYSTYAALHQVLFHDMGHGGQKRFACVLLIPHLLIQAHLQVLLPPSHGLLHAGLGFRLVVFNSLGVFTTLWIHEM